MPPSRSLRDLDDRVLGARGIALVAALMTLAFGSEAVAALVANEWPGTVIYILLTVGCGQAARITWHQR